MSIKRTIDMTNPLNEGLQLAGYVPAKASKDENGKWAHALIPADSVTLAEDGTVLSAIALVDSKGAATPVDLVEYVRTSTNGNYVFTIRRHAIPNNLKALRKVANDAAKASAKAPKAPTAQVVPKAPTAPEAPTAPIIPPAYLQPMPEAPEAPKAPTAPEAPNRPVTSVNVPPAVLQALIASGHTTGQIVAMFQTAPEAPEAPKAPKAPEAPKAPKAPKGSSVPNVAGKGGTVPPKQ